MNYGVAVDLNSTFLTVRAHAINDINNVDIIAVTNGNAIKANSYVRDTEPPLLTRFDLYLDSRWMRIRFHESIARNSFIPSLFALHGDSLINTSSSVNLSNDSYRHHCWHAYCDYHFPSDVLNVLTRNPNVARDASTTYLVIMQGGITDTSGNPINMTEPIMVTHYRPSSSKY